LTLGRCCRDVSVGKRCQLCLRVKNAVPHVRPIKLTLESPRAYISPAYLRHLAVTLRERRANEHTRNLIARILETVADNEEGADVQGASSPDVAMPDGQTKKSTGV
jgi:hypothetical protein